MAKKKEVEKVVLEVKKDDVGNMNEDSNGVSVIGKPGIAHEE